MRVVEGTAVVDDVDGFLAELGEVGEATGCAVQAFDARYVMGRPHLERAVELADRAFERGENVARERAVEVLLYAAGRRQIDRALAMGVGEGEQPVAVVVHAAGDGVETSANDSETTANDDEAPTDGADEAEAAERVEALLEPAATLGVEHADRERVRAFFDVSDAELAAAAGDLQDLVLERVALLDVEK